MVRRAWNPARDGGACTNTNDPEKFFPELIDENGYVTVPSDVVLMCHQCPFNMDCLKWALDNDAYGFWAGTSRYQRNQLKQDKHRVKCPGCSSENVYNDGRGEICIACGISWLI